MNLTATYRWGKETNSVSDLIFDKSGRFLTVAWTDGISLLDLARREEIRFHHTDELVWSVAATLTGDRIVAGLADGTTRLWETAGGSFLGTLSKQVGAVRSVAISPDGEFLATGGDDAIIRQWQLPDVKPNSQPLRIMTGHTRAIYDLVYVPNSQYLISASEDETVKLWNRATGEMVRSFDPHFRSVVTIAASQDGHVFATASWGTDVKLWRVNDGTLVRSLQAHLSGIGRGSIAFTSNSQVLFVGTGSGAIYCWNVSDGNLQLTLTEHEDALEALALSANDRWLASGSLDGEVILWTVAMS